MSFNDVLTKINDATAIVAGGSGPSGKTRIGTSDFGIY